MMLGVTSTVAQDYKYLAPRANGVGRDPQQYFAAPYQVRAGPLGHGTPLNPEVSGGSCGSSAGYYTSSPTANYADAQPLPPAPLLQYSHQPQQLAYEYTTGSQCSSSRSRSSSISISPIVNKSHIRLPPISALVPAAVYAPEKTPLDHLMPSPCNGYHSQLPQQVLVSGPAFLEHQQHLHSHSHPHLPSHPHQQLHSHLHPHPHQHLHPQHLHQTNIPAQFSRPRYDSVVPEQQPQQQQQQQQQQQANGYYSKNDSFKIQSPSSLNVNINTDNLDPSIRYRKQCPVCGKICSRPSTLKTHLLIHTGDTPFKCTWEGCNKSFNVKSNMLRHLKSHERKQAKKEGKKSEV
ncbi:hypothetical protein HG535_0B03490 [Zygotorulaspora mrakii]|uniref:C2H2-type domain-containing protein n=1 Tax=Zygotorulaspora mrakii TaxID=42260 RepID=A0A7H9AY19_ZYGMR|nr:uncharacterized protein HG535_0B03490 [Zygotorulaspora mrakii]QLG71310.1 hypothetical protein HG535_0B03490 [Zygotorulaspora mrakii]